MPYLLISPPLDRCLISTQDGACQLLSLVFRIHVTSSRAGAGGSPSTLLGTAAATARQAVALAFDHAVSCI